MKKFPKNRVIRTATKGTERSCWPPTRCNYILSLPCCIIAQSMWFKDVSALHLRSLTCFSPFSGSPNYPAFIKNLFTTFITFHYTLLMDSKGSESDKERRKNGHPIPGKSMKELWKIWRSRQFTRQLSPWGTTWRRSKPQRSLSTQRELYAG